MRSPGWQLPFSLKVIVKPAPLARPMSARDVTGACTWRARFRSSFRPARVLQDMLGVPVMVDSRHCATRLWREAILEVNPRIRLTS